MIERIKRLPFVVKYLQKKHWKNSTCKICGLPWSSCRSHTIEVRECTDFQSGKGFFPVCEWCWNHADYERNLQAVKDTYAMWERECKGRYDLPYTLEEMLEAFGKDWNQTHSEYE